MLRTKKEQARLASQARQEEEKSEERRRERQLAGQAREGGSHQEMAPLSSAPPLPSQKLLTCEGGGTGAGGDDQVG